jgi:ERCC4-type nuclease
MRELKPEQVTAVIDTREQTPLDLAPLRVEVGTLDTGDYTAKGLEHVVRIERKSLSDLVGCVGRERERFEREVTRLLAYPVRVLVVEATWEQIEAHTAEAPQWRGRLTAAQVTGSLLGWQAAGLSIHMAADHARAGRHVGRLLFTVARRRWRELQALADGVS